MRLFTSSSGRFWFPLDLSPSNDTAIADFQTRIANVYVHLDQPSADETCFALTSAMARHAGSILDREGVSHLSHMINGWGNARYRKRRLLEWFELFIRIDLDGQPYLLQMSDEGDNAHPWQSFAYAVMAGIGPEEEICPGITLGQLARNSQRISSPVCGRDLGHLLFASAHLYSGLNPDGFCFNGRPFSLRELADRAINAHFNDSFVVCRKIHLTEGLCAVAALVPGMEDLRSAAEGFFEGQMDVVLLIGTILEEVAQALDSGSGLQPDSVAADLRRKLGTGPYLENHCWYVGHLVEMAAFASKQGYELQPAHRNAIRYVLNRLNPAVKKLLPYVSFMDVFPGMSHYRRAVTLWAELERIGSEGRGPATANLTRYCSDFDAECTLAQVPSPLPERFASIYQVTPPQRPDERLAAIIDCYDSGAAEGFESWGHNADFRRVTPPSWPRMVHYEFLSYGPEEGTGVEIHLESEQVRIGASLLLSLLPLIQQTFPDRQVDWDPLWSFGRGRLRVRFPPSSTPEAVADTMRLVIQVTYRPLSGLICDLKFDTRHMHGADSSTGSAAL
jgi:hypothetical protein